MQQGYSEFCDDFIYGMDKEAHFRWALNRWRGSSGKGFGERIGDLRTGWKRRRANQRGWDTRRNSAGNTGNAGGWSGLANRWSGLSGGQQAGIVGGGVAAAGGGSYLAGRNSGRQQGYNMAGTRKMSSDTHQDILMKVAYEQTVNLLEKEAFTGRLAKKITSSTTEGAIEGIQEGIQKGFDQVSDTVKARLDNVDVSKIESKARRAIIGAGLAGGTGLAGLAAIGGGTAGLGSYLGNRRVARAIRETAAQK